MSSTLRVPYRLGASLHYLVNLMIMSMLCCIFNFVLVVVVNQAFSNRIGHSSSNITGLSLINVFFLRSVVVVAAAVVCCLPSIDVDYLDVVVMWMMMSSSRWEAILQWQHYSEKGGQHPRSVSTTTTTQGLTIPCMSGSRYFLCFEHLFVALAPTDQIVDH